MAMPTPELQGPPRSSREPAAVLVFGLLVLSAMAVGVPAAREAPDAIPSAPAALSVATGVPADHPSRLTYLGAAQQVIVVTSRSWTASQAVLRRWQRQADGEWRLAGPAVPARVGRNGFVPGAARRQGSAMSPAGTFAVVEAFGNGADPGTTFPYRVLDRNDWWPYDPRDPATYNVLQPRRSDAARWRTSWAEDLSGYGGQYRFVAALDFNLPAGVTRSPDGQRVTVSPADTRRGGGIFVHVNGPGPTVGCVSIPRDQMRLLLRWLDPGAEPVVVMGPLAAMDEL